MCVTCLDITENRVLIAILGAREAPAGLKPWSSLPSGGKTHPKNWPPIATFRKRYVSAVLARVNY